MINTFLGIYPPIYKTFVATLTLAIILRQQEQIQPYKIKIMNEVEFRESTTSIITLFGGMFFILESLPTAINVILVMVILICNIWFYSLWIHLFFKRSRFAFLRLIALFFGKISCLGKEYWQEEQKSLQSNHDMDFVFGKYDPKETKYNKIEEESKDQSFAGYGGAQENIIKDMSGGNSNTGSLQEKPKPEKKSGRKGGKEGKEEPGEDPTKDAEGTKKKKKKRIIRKKKVKKGEKKADDNYEEMDQDEIEQQINEELDAAEIVKDLPEEELEDPAPKKKKSARKEKKSGRKEKSSARKEIESGRREKDQAPITPKAEEVKTGRKESKSAKKENKSARKEEKSARKEENSARKESKSARKETKKSGRKAKKSGRKNSGDRVEPADNPEDQDIQDEMGNFSADEEAQNI